MYMPRAVGHQFDAVPIGADGGGAVAQCVVLVLPDGGGRFALSDLWVLLVFAHQLPCDVVVPVQLAAAVARLDELAVQVVVELFALFGLGVFVHHAALGDASHVVKHHCGDEAVVLNLLQ